MRFTHIFQFLVLLLQFFELLGGLFGELEFLLQVNDLTDSTIPLSRHNSGSIYARIKVQPKETLENYSTTPKDEDVPLEESSS